jgi:hypothetical protein
MSREEYRLWAETRPMGRFERIEGVVVAIRPRVVHHPRRDDGQGVETRMLTEGEITLDAPGISITVAEIYGR